MCDMVVLLKSLPITISIKKDSIKCHCLSEPYKEAAKLEMKSKFGALLYMESVIPDNPIGRAIKRICNKNMKILLSAFKFSILFSQTRMAIFRFFQLN